MTKIRPLATLLLLALLGIILAGPTGVPAAEPEPLRVLTIFPSGEVVRVKQFTVTFNQPMVPVGEMKAVADQVPVAISPRTEGTFRWLNVYTLAFEPQTPIEGSQEGEILVKAGATAQSGATLGKEVKVRFAVPLLAPLTTRPAAKAQNLALKPDIHVNFNQPADLDSLKAQAYFETEKGIRVGLEAFEEKEINARRKTGDAWICRLTPTKELPRDTAFHLVLPAGLKSTVGPRLSGRVFRIPFQTYGPFRVKEIIGYGMMDGAPNDPESGVEIKFTNPVNIDDIKKALKVAPEYDLEALDEDIDTENDITTLWLPGPFPAGKTVKFTFGPELTDSFGQKIEGRTTWQVAFGPARPILDLPGRHGVIEAGTDPTYPFQARNVLQVSARAVFLEPDKIIPFILEHRLYEYLESSLQDILKELPRKEIKTTRFKVAAPANTATYQPVKLKELFGDKVGKGVLYFDLSAPEIADPESKAPVFHRALVQVTDLGLSVKFGIDNTLIWTTDLKTGKPLGQVRLELRSAENQVLWQGRSDEQGLAQAPGAAGFKINRSEEYGEPVLFVLAWHESQFAIMGNDWNQGIAPWNFGLRPQELSEGQDLRTFVMTALPLYKPGDEVQYKIIQRQAGPQGQVVPTEKKLQVQIRNSRGTIIEKKDLTLNRFGTASGRLTLPAEAALGHYSVQVESPGRRLSYAGSFKVEAYRKPTFAVKLAPSAATAFPGETIKTEISASYHFGSPVRGQEVTYSVLTSPADFTLPRFEDYIIQDLIMAPDEEEHDGYPSVAEGKINLDEAGKTSVDFQTTAPKHPKPRTFEIEAMVTDVDERGVSQRATVLVHPAAIYLGLKSDDFLLAAGGQAHFTLIAARPDGQLQAGQEVELNLIRRVWQTVRRKGLGGYYNYVSKPVDTVVEKTQVKTGFQPLEVNYQMGQGGYYYLTAKTVDQNGRPASTNMDFYVYGEGAAGWEYFDHDRIDLVANKKDYKPGDKATIMVKSPFAQGSGLLTVEKGGVVRQQIFQINGPAPLLEVGIEEGDGPNVFVSVLLVRGRVSEKLEKGLDVGKPSFKVGYVELKVAEERGKLNVEVKPERPQARPGEDIELAVKVTDPTGRPQMAEVALIVADAALLQLDSEDGYYPQRLFLAPRPLGVWTTDNRLNLIGRRHYGLKGAKPGGGGGPEGDSARFRRKFVSLAFYEPHLVTDENGEVRTKFKLPDNLTTFKIFAVANTEADRYGTGTGGFLVTKPLLIQPGLPNFIGVGDQMQAAVVVHNRSETGGDLAVTISGEEFEAQGPATKTVAVGPKSSVEVGFPVKARAGTEAVFKFQATLGAEKDAAEFRVPLRYPNVLTTAATYGRLVESGHQNIKLPERADPARGALSLTVSPSLVGALAPAFDYLRMYPHECLEQKTSKAFGDLLALGWQGRLGRAESEAAGIERRLQKYLDGLAAYQGDEGGFSFWPASRQPEPYLSGYVVQFLILAKAQKRTVDQTQLEQALAFIASLVQNDRWPSYYSPRERLATKSYLTAVLAEAGRPVEALIENLYNQREAMGPFELALLLETLGFVERDKYTVQQIKEVNRRLFAQAVLTSGEVHFEEKTPAPGLMASWPRTNAFVLRALLKTAPEDPHLVSLARWLVQSARNGYWGSTQASATVLMALNDYIAVMEDQPPGFSIEAVLDGRSLGTTSFERFDQPPQTKELTNRELTPGRKMALDMKYEGQGSAYYTLRLAWAPLEPDLAPDQAGLALSRTYTVADPAAKPGGEAPMPQTTFKRGDLVKVEVTMLVPSQRHWVVLEDWLPAGLEPINFDLPVAPRHLQSLLTGPARPEEYYSRYWYQHREIRSDRVAVYARILPEGVYTFSYLARAVTTGKFMTPGSGAEEMYSPETYGRGAGTWLEIKDK